MEHDGVRPAYDNEWEVEGQATGRPGLGLGGRAEDCVCRLASRFILWDKHNWSARRSSMVQKEFVRVGKRPRKGRDPTYNAHDAAADH